jgi:hypothetical protein
MPVSISGTNGVTFPDNSLQAAAASPYVLKNRLINSAMVIDQRNAGASVTINSDQYTVDRWKAFQSAAGKYSVQQNASSVTPPAGFTNYLGATSLSSYSVASGDYFLLNQAIEGYNVADLDFGKATAKTITISFWVRSSLTGTFGAAYLNDAFNRTYPFTYTISSANTWEYKTVTIAGDTTGTWNTTNGNGGQLRFVLGCGSSRLSSSINQWVAGGFDGPTGATSVVGTNGATFYITGVQLEQNTTATPFERRLYGQELINCQRYYWRLIDGNTQSIGIGAAISASELDIVTIFPVSMRTGPTLSVATGTNYYKFERNGGADDFNSFTIARATTQSALIYNVTEISSTAGQAGEVRSNNASASLAFSAEL